ncbi:hypothetical protein QWT68_09785 [Sporosarcina trichiuri]|nr:MULTISPECIES: hypothetical protein [Sporosarcina]WJY26374.1 hypothetical protein QWT68_09785 [Sporosarcina sp. 0.2-SM1T-5]
MDGEVTVDQQELYFRLVRKTRRGLAVRYVEDKMFPSGQPYLSSRDMVLKGMLQYDPSDEELPLMVIDGQPYSWEAVGRMLSAFEGFHVTIEMADLADV